MGRKPIGRRAMTGAELVRRHREKKRAARLKRAATRMDAIARPVIAGVVAKGDTTPEAILEGLRAAGLSIVKTKSLK